MNPYFIWLTLKRCYRGVAVVGSLITQRELVRELPWSYIKRRVSRRPVMIIQIIAIFGMAVVVPLSTVISPLTELTPFAFLAWFAAVGATMIRWVGRFIRDVRDR